MQSIEAQLELERTMVRKGAEAFEQTQKEAEKNGRGASTTYARRLLQDFMLPLIEALTLFVETNKPGKHGRVRILLARCSAEKAMYLAMQAVFNAFTHEAPLAGLATRIGRMVEDEVRFSRFQEMHGDYYDAIQKDFKRKGTKNYRFMHRVLTHKANEHADQWIDWTVIERAEIGMKLIDIILLNTDLMEKRQFNQHGKTRTLLLPTDTARAWVEEHNEFAKFLFPDKMPCIVEPDEWTALDQGGYYSPELRHATPMVKTSSKRHRRHVRDGDLAATQDALNILQAVPWEVNTATQEFVTKCWNANLRIGMPPKDPLTIPPSPVAKRDGELTPVEQALLTDWKHEAAEIHTQEKERRSKSFQTSRIIRLAAEYASYESFWYVWYSDFRGRFYPTTSGFNPQGADIAKGILRFKVGKELGERGWYWHRVHGANRFGHDKVSYDDRVKWVGENHEFFIRAAQDPMSHTDVWGNADKPWQFLAWLDEYRRAWATGNPHAFVSHLPIGLDGTCNGLQHFSAMLRDAKGGAATNLVPGALPSDIYARVARVCTEKLRAKQDDPEARMWLAYCEKHGDMFIPRKLAKRPVMTRPYGSTRQSCTQYIFEYIMEKDRTHFPTHMIAGEEGPEAFSNFKAACWLTPLLWTSIDEVVVSAKDAMGWLQQCAGVLAKDNQPLTWAAPDGFPVYQGMRVIHSTKIETQLGGRFQLRVGNFSDDIDRNKQRQGASPNFVHSQDAAHMRAVVRRCRDEGILNLAFIHDDFGTHACDTDKLHGIIRDTFVSMYADHDPLGDLQKLYEDAYEFPPIPEHGDLDIQGVRQSEYFFG